MNEDEKIEWMNLTEEQKTAFFDSLIPQSPPSQNEAFNQFKTLYSGVKKVHF